MRPFNLTVVSASTPSKLESKPVTIHGKLAGRSAAAQTIVIAAHYDASGIVPVSYFPTQCSLNVTKFIHLLIHSLLIYSVFITQYLLFIYSLCKFNDSLVLLFSYSYNH